MEPPLSELMDEYWFQPDALHPDPHTSSKIDPLREVSRCSTPDEEVISAQRSSRPVKGLQLHHLKQEETTTPTPDKERAYHSFTAGHSRTSLAPKSMATTKAAVAATPQHEFKYKEYRDVTEPKPLEPPEPLGNAMVDEGLPCSARMAWALVFDPNSKFIRDFYCSRGYWDVEIGAWKSQGHLQVREASYKMPLNIMMGPSQAECIEVQTLVARQDGGFFLDVQVMTPSAPYGGCFHIAMQWVVWSQGCNKSRIRLTCQVEFSRLVLLVKGLIVQSAVQGMRDTYGDFMQALRTQLNSIPMEPSTAFLPLPALSPPQPDIRTEKQLVKIKFSTIWVTIVFAIIATALFMQLWGVRTTLSDTRQLLSDVLEQQAALQLKLDGLLDGARCPNT